MKYYANRALMAKKRLFIMVALCLVCMSMKAQDPMPQWTIELVNQNPGMIDSIHRVAIDYEKVQEMEGTVVSFRAGEDNEYQFVFVYDHEDELYLLDTELNNCARVRTGGTYLPATDKRCTLATSVSGSSISMLYQKTPSCGMTFLFVCIKDGVSRTLLPKGRKCLSLHRCRC